MALGGGTFVTQNKVLPGSYINFVSLAGTSSVFGERGTAAAPLSIDWGAEDEVIEVSAGDFEKNSLKIFGYDYTNEKMKPYRDLFKNAKLCYFYRISGGNKASAALATAKYGGTRGNSIFYTIEQNLDNSAYYDVCTYIRSVDSTVESNKIYDFENSKVISSDIVNVGGKASISQDNSGDGDNPYTCVIDGVREGTDLDSTGKPVGRALCFMALTVPCKIKVTCINNTASYMRAFVSGTSTSTISPAISGNTATFTIAAGSDAVKDVYLYGTSKIRMTKIEIIYDGAVADTLVDKQTVTGTTSNLQDNDFVTWIKSKSLTETAGTFLTGGSNTAATGQSYQSFLDAIEGHTFNVLICDSLTDTIKGLFVNFTKRMRDETGVKFQTVVYKYAGNYEGVINLTTAVSTSPENSIVWWLGGAEAACAINKSCTNMLYDGEYEPVCKDTQTELENAINNGEIKLHKVGTDYRVLMDINSLTEFTDEKGEIFKENQTIRVCDQIAMDIATIFNTKYLGKVQNDDAGRTALWADIVKHHNQLMDMRAIEDFESDDVTVAQGDTKRSVVVTDNITVVNAMEQLYMTVVVA